VSNEPKRPLLNLNLPDIGGYIEAFKDIAQHIPQRMTTDIHVEDGEHVWVIGYSGAMKDKLVVERREARLGGSAEVMYLPPAVVDAIAAMRGNKTE
jgi:hypothetical protein